MTVYVFVKKDFMLDYLADLYLVCMASFCKWSSNDDILMSGMSCCVQNMCSCFAQLAAVQ